jgi:hypothetical protein
MKPPRPAWNPRPSEAAPATFLPPEPRSAYFRAGARSATRRAAILAGLSAGRALVRREWSDELTRPRSSDSARSLEPFPQTTKPASQSRPRQVSPRR